MLKKTKQRKIRADKLLVEKGYFESRAKARDSILAGSVRVGKDRVLAKSSEEWDPQTVFTISKPFPYVSRGALKLIPALDKYLARLSGCVALDIGASTGGFTEVLIQRDALRVYAVDVGYGQLHYRLRSHPRVVCLEKINARYLNYDQVPEQVDILTADLSFISLTKVLPVADQFLKPDFLSFVLIKPQFEAKRHEVSKGGVVKSVEVTNRVIKNICEFTKKNIGWDLLEILPSPIKGPKGNQEYMGVFRSLCRESRFETTASPDCS